MTWLDHHRVSETYASQAQTAFRDGEVDRARLLYGKAADSERKAVACLDRTKTRTLSVSWVSMTSLYYKAGMIEYAADIGWKGLEHDSLAEFAKQQLRDLLQLISKFDSTRPASTGTPDQAVPNYRNQEVKELSKECFVISPIGEEGTETSYPSGSGKEDERQTGQGESRVEE